jgi:hypothetical protein
VRGLFQVARPVERAVEASPQQIAATGAAGGAGYDPIDRESGWRRSGVGRREVPEYTRQRAVDSSVAGYRSNSMGVAVVDTYVSFIVGDKGVGYTCSNPDVEKVVREFWDDPAVRFGQIQPALLRSQILWGELPVELMVGAQSGAVRLSVMDPAVVDKILLDRGNPLWPSKMVLTAEDGNEPRSFDLVRVDDADGLRKGNAFFFAPWKTLITDTRGVPFLTPILDQLDSYDTVLSNLIDRTSLARYLVWDVEVKGSQPQVDAYIQSRGGLHIPPSGSVEVHNESVKWTPMSAPSGAQEDTQAAGAVLTQVAGGAGLAKTWLAEPDGANRATSLTMAEPVRRRVGLVQAVWLDQMTEIVRFVVDQAVAAGRIPAMVEATDPRTGAKTTVPAAMTVLVTGPEIAAADAQLTAQTLLNIATGLDTLVKAGLLTPQAAARAAQKAWEDYMGIPWSSDLDGAGGDPVEALAQLGAAGDGGAEVIPIGGAREAVGHGNAAELHKYWTKGEGLAKWAESPHPWTTLYGHLRKYIPDDDKAKRTAAQWFFDVFHYWPGADLNRVAHGKPPRGDRVGPG